jgi:hypothetical protein
VLQAYVNYQVEQAGLIGEGGSEMMFANLFRELLGAPMAYRSGQFRIAVGDRAAGVGLSGSLRLTDVGGD